jgi:hypothetical protein
MRHDHRASNGLIMGCLDTPKQGVPEGNIEFKRDRENDYDPVVLPEVRPYIGKRAALRSRQVRG